MVLRGPVTGDGGAPSAKAAGAEFFGLQDLADLIKGGELGPLFSVAVFDFVVSLLFMSIFFGFYLFFKYFFYLSFFGIYLLFIIYLFAFAHLCNWGFLSASWD